MRRIKVKIGSIASAKSALRTLQRDVEKTVAKEIEKEVKTAARRLK